MLRYDRLILNNNWATCYLLALGYALPHLVIYICMLMFGRNRWRSKVLTACFNTDYRCILVRVFNNNGHKQWRPHYCQLRPH